MTAQRDAAQREESRSWSWLSVDGIRLYLGSNSSFRDGLDGEDDFVSCPHFSSVKKTLSYDVVILSCSLLAETFAFMEAHRSAGN